MKTFLLLVLFVTVAVIGVRVHINQSEQYTLTGYSNGHFIVEHDGKRITATCTTDDSELLQQYGNVPCETFISLVGDGLGHVWDTGDKLYPDVLLGYSLNVIKVEIIK